MLRPNVKLPIFMGILLVFSAVAGLSLLLGGDMVGAQTEEVETTGNLVIVPSSLGVGDAIEVVAFDVKPSNVLVAFRFDEHFVPAGESCDDAESRTTSLTPAPAWIPLKACSTGEGRVQLLDQDTQNVIAEATATIAEAGGAAEPRQQGCGLMFDQPCPPAPSVSHTNSPTTPSQNYTITVSWGGTGYDEYKVSGDLGSYTGDSTSKGYYRPCAQSYNISVQGHGDNVHYAPVWSPSTSSIVKTGDCPTRPPTPIPPTATPTPTPTNRSPVFSSSSTTRSVPENTASGANIGSPVTATDPDGDALTYSIGGTDSSSFSIASSSGQLRTKAALDYETKSSYSVTVTAEDTSNASDSITVTIGVTNLDETGRVNLSSTHPEVGKEISATLSDPDGGVSSISWQWQSKSKQTSDGTLDWQNISRASSSRYTPLGVHVGIQLRATVTYTDSHGPGKSATGSPTQAVSKPKLSSPTNLDVTPMSLRRAQLSWTGDSNATGYVVRVDNPDRRHGTVNIDGTTTSIVIHLDNILASQGLAEQNYFDFQVMATDSTGTRLDSGYSKKIRIVDNPVLTSGSARKPDTGNAWIELKWDKVSGVTNYTVSYRPLGVRLDDNNGTIDEWLHSHTDWPSDVQWPNYLDSSKRSVRQPVGSTVSTQFSTLFNNALYAFQVNYKTSSGMKVFSARDAYAWTSHRVPLRSQRVGTYPFFGYWENGRYDYTICEDTFDDPMTTDDESSEWTPLIEHAFEQWEEAVSDELTISHVTGSCISTVETPGAGAIDYNISNDVPISLVRALFNGSNEVYMVDTSDWHSAIIPILGANIPFLCIESAPACVISTRYTDHRPFTTSRVQALDDGSVDVLVNSNRETYWEDNNKIVRKKDIPGDDKRVDEEDTKFNECKIGTGDSNFSNYRLMVHEAGHALGLSEISTNRIWQPYDVAHPTVPDAVMNYDDEVSQITYEPDCAPHPFDIMAIHALYQTVDP